MTHGEAAATFRCGPYACTMPGTDCAKRHATAVQTRDARRGKCIACPDGAQRASALGIGRPRCPAAPDGIVCGAAPEPGRRTCRAHRAHEEVTRPVAYERRDATEYDAAPAEPVPTTGRRVPVSPVDMDCRRCRRRYVTSSRSPEAIREWCPRCRDSVRGMLRRAYRDDSPETMRRVLLGDVSRDVDLAPSATVKAGVVECRECGRVGTRRLLDGDPLRPWCRNCRNRAAKALRVRGIEPQSADLVRWLSTPKQERARPAYYERHECPTCGQRVRRRRIKA